MLFDPAQHEPLTSSPWDTSAAVNAVDSIIDQTLKAQRPGRFWSRHPEDDYEQPGDHDLGFWIGAAGVLWALNYLGAEPAESDLYESYRSTPSLHGAPGLMTGEAGVLLVSWQLAPTADKEDRLFELVAANRDNLANELFEGSPGTMAAALGLYEATDAKRWADLWRDSAEVLLKRFTVDPELNSRIWVQNRRGRLIRSIGAGHGFASNVHALMRGQTLLEPAVIAHLTRDATDTAKVLAISDGGLRNWPAAADPYWAEQMPIRVQWCHGAPGLITSLADLPEDHGLDAMLSAAGELVWAAGPLRKGPGLCHGSAGNACAFLALHRRFADELWLERARAFAMHALGQLDPDRPRHSLWTGDIGVAVALDACLHGYRGLPAVDVL